MSDLARGRDAVLIQPDAEARSGGEIRGRVLDTEKLMSMLHERLDELEDRLHDVVADAVPTDDGGKNSHASPGTVTELGGRIESVNDAIRYSLHRLERILGRIEL